jgi:hypothetical protein
MIIVFSLEVMPALTLHQRRRLNLIVKDQFVIDKLPVCFGRHYPALPYPLQRIAWRNTKRQAQPVPQV